MRPIIQQGLRQYKDEVLSGHYPYGEFTQRMAAEEHERFMRLVGGATA